MRITAINAVLIVSCLFFPSVAHADVLQIGSEGAQWIAGGPSPLPVPRGEFTNVDGENSLAETPSAEVSGPLHPQSITQAANTAGPARWRDHIARLANKYDISPALLEALVWQESRWNEQVVSPVGARGLTQLMPGTAAQLGVNSADPMANLEGGARYLRMQFDAFGGNIEKALAAYNAGPGRVIKANGIPNIRETKAYVTAIMARLSDPVRQ